MSSRTIQIISNISGIPGSVHNIKLALEIGREFDFQIENRKTDDLSPIHIDDQTRTVFLRFDDISKRQEGPVCRIQSWDNGFRASLRGCLKLMDSFELTAKLFDNTPIASTSLLIPFRARSENEEAGFQITLGGQAITIKFVDAAEIERNCPTFITVIGSASLPFRDHNHNHNRSTCMFLFIF